MNFRNINSEILKMTKQPGNDDSEPPYNFDLVKIKSPNLNNYTTKSYLPVWKK